MPQLIWKGTITRSPRSYTGDVGGNIDDVANELVPEGERPGKRGNPGDQRSIEITRRDCDRAYQRVTRPRQFGLGYLTPPQAAGTMKGQLLHTSS